MNRIVLFLPFLFFLVRFPTATANICSEVYVRTYDYSNFNLMVDNQIIPGTVNQFRLANMMPGYHMINISPAPVVVQHHQAFYQGQVYIPQASRVYLMLDQYNIIRTINIFPIVGGAYNFHISPWGQELSYLPNRIITEESFDALKKAVSETSSDVLKLNMAKHALFFTQITSKQVGELMLLFSFDKDRIELARYSFYFIVDKENFSSVYNNLIFNGSKTELRNLIWNNYGALIK
ncbi:MAG: DUF4476 domain-containing protein [Cytophagaceae bacterium]